MNVRYLPDQEIELYMYGALIYRGPDEPIEIAHNEWYLPKSSKPNRSSLSARLYNLK